MSIYRYKQIYTNLYSFCVYTNIYIVFIYMFSPVIWSVVLPQHLKQVLSEHIWHTVVTSQLGGGRGKRLNQSEYKTK